MDFAEWIDFEAKRIVSMSFSVSEEYRADYMIIQIQAALKKAFAHGRDGLTKADAQRLTATW